MRTKTFYLCLEAAFLLCGMQMAFGSQLVWEDIGGGLDDVTSIAIGANDTEMIYAGSKHSLYKSENSGSDWKNVLTVRGAENSINFILIDPCNSDYVYAGSGKGLFRSSDRGESWERIFLGKNYKESTCNSLLVSSECIYLATESGIFVSTDEGTSWQRSAGDAGKVRAIALTGGDYIYAATDAGVLRKLKTDGEWERVFVNSRPEDSGETEEQEQPENNEEESNGIKINHIGVDQDNVYLGTSEGVYRSVDKGRTWEAMADEGLLGKEIKFLLIGSKSGIYCATKSGIFRMAQNRWEELSERLVSKDIRSLAGDNQSRLYAACKNGIFRLAVEESGTDTGKQNLSVNPIDGPSIEEVQKAAIRYAEVSPEKIINWRKQASRKAWLPEVSMGLNRDTGDLLHWESGSAAKDNDDILRKGKDCIDWDITLSWDLGELIWNADQTSIDVRSKLMVELRDDIVNEVTKLYFERIRVKNEIEGLSIEDKNKLAEKELRQRELTAYLDGLTGGYFSRTRLQTPCNADK